MESSNRARPRWLHQIFEASAERNPGAVAVEFGNESLTYCELEQRANQLAHFLQEAAIGLNSRVALLLPRCSETYVSLLGTGKAGAAFVPIDPEAPPDRVSYITKDAGADVLLTVSWLAGSAAAVTCRVVELDRVADEIARAPISRPLVKRGPESDPLAYVMYTSGSSGRPKGVEITQSSICNFLAVVPSLYDVRPGDRVYQGMTISFDFSIEEIWPTWAVGAALVSGQNGSARLGSELADFLEQREVSVLYCVPTLLATIPRALPRIRNILVGGEACPGKLVERWSRPGRRILNTYGPTEATVTATWAELRPGQPVTIGRPLPTYSVVLLDDDLQPVPDGQVGEICIGGPGVARGYVGRPDLTAQRFVRHPLAPSGGRLYRTGDLGRLLPDGQIEYLGRADAEVKVRGHRVDLGEIENVMLEEPRVTAAAAALVPTPGPDGRELAGYLVLSAAGCDDEDVARTVHDRLRQRLPAYMVPPFLEIVPTLPTMPSGKVDRGRLPSVTRRRLTGAVVAPGNELETRLRAAWAEIFGLEPQAVSVAADFFIDLGGHSLLAARAVSLLRESHEGPSPTLRELYDYPTIRQLADHLTTIAHETDHLVVARAPAVAHSARRVAAAGFGQAMVIYLLLLLITVPISYVYTWNDGQVSARVLEELMIAGLVTYLGVRWTLPVLLARPLAVGLRPGRYPLWGWTYLRVWALHLLLSIGPISVLSGSPFLPGYLRCLGARIGARAMVATSMISVPSMLSIGPDASIGYGVSLRPWRVEDGWLIVDRIVVGARAFVGANAVLEPGCEVGAEAGLGEQSLLGATERVPVEARWSGSPAGPTPDLGPVIETMLRRRAAGWRVGALTAACLGLLGLEVAPIGMLVPAVVVVWWALLGWGVLAGLAATLLAGPVYVVTVCVVVAAGKWLVLPSAPAGIHPARSWLGVRKWVADKLLELSLTLTNSLYATLYTVPWLRSLGARIGHGAEVSTAAHLDPSMLTLGEGSFVADMASVGSATFAAGQLAFLPTEVGRRAFVGNAAVVPTGTILGPGSLVGVSTVPPRIGVAEGSSWLGSPAFQLPVRQSSGTFPEAMTFRPARSVVMHRLLIEFWRATLPATLHGVIFYLYLLALSGLAKDRDLPVPAFGAPLVAICAGFAAIIYCAAVKRNVIGVYDSRVEPLWSKFVRRTEFVTGLYEAAAVPAGIALLVGTPFLPMVLRWFGARIGKRTWIGTTYLTEFDLVTIGDDAAIGLDVSLQTHLFEDRIMKMSTVTVDAGASVGTRAVVLYDSVIGENVSLGALSLLMKGEKLPPGTSWRGIPARGAREHRLSNSSSQVEADASCARAEMAAVSAQ